MEPHGQTRGPFLLPDYAFGYVGFIRHSLEERPPVGIAGDCRVRPISLWFYVDLVCFIFFGFPLLFDKSTLYDRLPFTGIDLL